MNIKLNHLSKRFERDVLKDLTLSDEVKTLALIGRSGCGKSTLLRILGGLLHATSGAASLDGSPCADSSEYRQKVGFVFQQGGLFSHLSAFENITLPLTAVHGLSAEEASERAHVLLARFGLSADGHKRPSALSGGQRQRVAIARAIAPKPRILLLDEPTSALDPEYTSEVLTVINELQKEDLSLIIATHEMGFARHACEKVAFLDQGKIAEYGASETLFAHPQTDALKAFLSKLLQWQ